MSLTTAGELRSRLHGRRRFIGGPCDGHRLEIPTPAPPIFRLEMPKKFGVDPVLDMTRELIAASDPMQVALYRLHEDGHYHFERVE